MVQASITTAAWVRRSTRCCTACTLPMRAEDNWNIQTTAALVLQVLAAMTAHASALLFHGGALKSQVRAAADPTSVDWMIGWPGDV